jgi:hypothetical protein
MSTTRFGVPGEGALVQELKRLTLENASLKAQLVMMDRERECHAMPIKGRAMTMEPLYVDVPIEVWVLSQGNTEKVLAGLRRDALFLLVDKVVQQSRVPSIASLDGDRLRYSMWCGAI